MTVKSFLSRIVVLALLLCILSPSSAMARVIKVGIGFSLPPYVIRDTGDGIEVDIIRRAFELVGHEAVFVYLPNLRLPVAFAQGEVDCIAANVAYDLEEDSGRKVYGSRETLSYQNYAISLSESNLDIRSVSDLGHMRVLGFNNATKYLGPEFARMANANDGYSELADQSLQVRMLYSKRVDVIISDKRIFLWWRQQVKRANVLDPKLFSHSPVFHPVFNPAQRRVGFGDGALRDAFDKGLQRLLSSDELGVIKGRYLGPAER